MGVLQLIANIKHRKPSNFSSQPLPVYNQPFHTPSHVGGNNPLLVYASTTNPHHLNITKVHPLAADIGMVPRTAGQEPAMHNPVSVTSNAKQIWTILSTTDRCIFLHGP